MEVCKKLVPHSGATMESDKIAQQLLEDDKCIAKTRELSLAKTIKAQYIF